MFDHLEIPEFLRRKTGEEIAPEKKRRTTKRRSTKGNPKVHLHLDNELPKIGSGHRFVTVEKIGRKWVTLVYGGRRHRVAKRKWETLKRIEA